MIELRLQPDIEAQLAAEARERGLPLDLYIAKIVETRPSVRQGRESELREAVEAMLSFAQRHNAKLAGLNLKEMIHEGHRY
jgi:hypothetical protein